MEKLHKIYGALLKNSTKALAAVFAIFLMIASFCFTSLMDMDETTYYNIDLWYVNIMVLVLFCSILVCITKKNFAIPGYIKHKRKIWYFALIIYGVGLLAFVFYTRLDPRADQGSVMRIALRMTKGDYSEFEPGGYAYRHTHQVGLIYLSYLLFKITHIGYHAIRIMNVLSIVFTVIGINEIGNLLFQKSKSEKKYIYGYVTMLFLPAAGYVTFLYGNCIGFALSVLGIMFACKYMNDHRMRYIIPMILCFALSVCIRKNFIINVVAVIIFLLYDFFKCHEKQVIFCMVGIVVGIFLVMFGVKARVEYITGESLDNGVPSLAYVVMGMQESEMASGWCNNYNQQVYFDNDCDPDKTAEVVKADFKNELDKKAANPADAIAFYYRKNISQWNNPTFECFWINDIKKRAKEEIEVKSYPSVIESLLGEPGPKWLVEYMNLFQSIVWFGIVLWIFQKRKDEEINQWMLATIFVGGFVFHTIWEAKCQYTIPFFMLLFPYAVQGYSSFSKMIANKMGKK